MKIYVWLPTYSASAVKPVSSFARWLENPLNLLATVVIAVRLLTIWNSFWRIGPNEIGLSRAKPVGEFACSGCSLF